MSKNVNSINSSHLASIGNFTKHAVESFEEGIVNEHNYLEKVDKNLKSKTEKRQERTGGIAFRLVL